MTQIPAIEIIPIPDTFASGVSEIENIGHGMIRVYYYVVQGPQRILVAKIVMPADMVLAARPLADRALMLARLNLQSEQKLAS